MTSRLHTLWPLFVLAVAPARATDVYKWLDEDGRTHYGDSPGVPGAVPLELEPARRPDEQQLQRADRRGRLLDAWAEERAERQAREDAERQAQEARKARCDEARRTLGEYRQAAYIYDLDRQGERRILSGPEHATAMDQARAAVARWCGTGPPEIDGTSGAKR